MGESEINNKKVKIRNKEVDFGKESYILSCIWFLEILFKTLSLGAFEATKIINKEVKIRNKKVAVSS